LLAVLLVLPAGLFIAPKNAHAQLIGVPVNETGLNLIQNTNTSVQTSANSTKEYALDQIGWIVSKVLISQMTRSIVNWINSGFNGNPSFVDDPGNFFLGVGDRVAGEFIEGSSLAFLCSPFRLDIKIALAVNYSSRFEDKINCTLTDVINNVQGFLDGDFAQGGWDGLFAVTQRPTNNPYGAYLEANAGMSASISGAKSLNLLDLELGKGFLSLKDENGKIITPGSVINDQLSQVLGSGFRQLELADELDEIVGALAGQLVSQVLGGGGLRGLSSGSYLNNLNTESSALLTEARNKKPPTTITDLGGSEADETGDFNFGPQARDFAEQSNQWRGYSANNAVDGNTGSAIASGCDACSAAVTSFVAGGGGQDTRPWWQVDLRGKKAISSLRIYTITVFGSYVISPTSALGDFRVFISDTPFPDNFDPTNPPAGIWSSGDITATESITPVDINKSGRYVRVQRMETARNNHLILAEVQIFRNNKPIITILGGNPQEVTVGHAYVELGATAFDQSDEGRIGPGGGNLSTRVDLSGLDVSKIGSYKVIYSATDSGGALAEKTRVVNVIANERPTISIETNPVNVIEGTAFDPLNGVTATDKEDGVIDSSNIVVGGDGVDTATVRTYLITYDITDSDGASAFQKTRVINVIANTP